MDNQQTVQSTSQMSSDRINPRSDGQTHQDAQLYSSTPARNMSMSSHGMEKNYSNSFCQNDQSMADLRSSQIPSQTRLSFDESIQQNVRDVGFENIVGSNFSEGAGNMFRFKDSLKANQQKSGYGPSPVPQEKYGQEYSMKENKAKCNAKEKKSITTKTFAKGMMDVSLLTSNATQLRAVLSNQEHEFYRLLLWLITLSITLQILSSILLLMSDYFKTDVKETDRQNQKKRKFLNFLSLALVTVVTSINILISVFSTSSTPVVRTQPSTTQEEIKANIPQFTTSSTLGSHSEL